MTGVELPLYSSTIGVAGRCDLIAEWDGVLSVIDFKSSTSPKKREWVTPYFLQALFLRDGGGRV